MVFSSLEFLFIFLPVFFIIYLITPSKYKNIVILITSILFYGYGTISHPAYTLLIIISIIFNYALGILIGTSERFRRGYLAIGMILNFGCLLLFKYANFFLTQYSYFFHVPTHIAEHPIFHLLLPIGISFYTFQAASYLIDVYWDNIEYEESLIDFGAYISMFPQLIAGPIVTYTEVRHSLKKRVCNVYTISDGLKTFIFGLGMKILIANRVGSIWTTAENIGYESISTQLAWLAILARSFQIYFDFFGYSLMAVGLGQMLGFHFPQNFNHPYLSITMTDFWRRWHITLGRWFREYVYIPLGGNRAGKIITYRNLFIIWTLTGLWHGASLNFLLWGLILFFIIAIEKAFLGEFLEKYPPIGRLYMFLLIPITWVVFSITDFHQLIIFYKKLFPFLGEAGDVVFKDDYIKYFFQNWVYLLLGFIFSTKYPYKIYAILKNHIVGILFILIVFWLSIYNLYQGLNDPFLYFRF